MELSHIHRHIHTHTYTRSTEAYRALLLKWSKLPGVKKRQQLKKDRQQRGREKEGEASRTEEFAGGTGWEWQFDCWGAQQGSACLRGWCWTQVICMLPSLCMLFRWSGGWTVCGHLQLQDGLSASAFWLVCISGLFSHQLTWLVATSRVSLHDRVFV